MIKDNFIIDIIKDYKGSESCRGVPIYIIKPIFFDYCKKLIKNLEQDKELRETDVMLKMILDKRKVMAIEFEGKLIHITTDKDVERENSN